MCNVFHCSRCKRRLSAQEPIYREHRADPGFRVSCGDCAFKERQWRPAAPCANCGRPVHNHDWYGLRAGELIVCDIRCRKAAYSSRGKLRRAKAPFSFTCQFCGQDGSSRRAERQYCSRTCKQAAYRQRMKLLHSGWASSNAGVGDSPPEKPVAR